MRKKTKGQAALEYVLLMLVVIIIGVSAFNKMNAYFFDNNGFFARYANSVKNVFSAGSGVNLKYKRFVIKR